VDNPYQPPSAAAPPASPQSPANLRNPRPLALASLWLYGISMIAEVADHVRRSVAPPLPDFSGPGFHDTYHVVSAGLTPFDWLMLLTGIGSIITYLMWKYRAARNARILDPSVARISPGMAVGSYFIPFAQLVIPCQAMAGIARASKVRLAWVAVWWAAHLGTLAGVVVFAMMSAAPEGFGPPTMFEHGFLIWSLLTFMFSWQIVMRITRAQSASCASGGVAPV
jgi:hypothetical protein